MFRLLKVLVVVAIAKLVLFTVLMLWTKSILKSAVGAWALAAVAGWWVARRGEGDTALRAPVPPAAGA
jgi:hypothetical protein